MSYLFISHASEDKEAHIRPIIEVLLAEGERLWIDRPGIGENNFGFSQRYISEHKIEQIYAGVGYVSSIQQALRDSGAVLGCLSRALLKRRDVILNELAVAATLGKLVTCIVDDMEFAELPEFSAGLLDTATIQTPRINTLILRDALEMVKTDQVSPNKLPTVYNTLRIG